MAIGRREGATIRLATKMHASCHRWSSVALISKSMGVLVSALRKGFVGFLERTGFCELVGGRIGLESELDSLQVRLLPLVGEVIAVEGRGGSLADAVFDTESSPHLAKLHGWFSDILHMRVPREVEPWVRKVMALGQSMDDDQLYRILALLTFRGTSPAERALGRFVYFEMLCINARLQILAAGDVVGLRRDSVERVADQEIRKAAEASEYSTALLDPKDPVNVFKVLFGSTMLRMGSIVEHLRQEVRTMSRDLIAVMSRRQELDRRLNQMDPAEAVLIRNAFASEFDDETLAVEQLKILHPGLLGDLPSEVAARKRLERARRRLTGELPARTRQPTLADLLLEGVKRQVLR